MKLLTYVSVQPTIKHAIDNWTERGPHAHHDGDDQLLAVGQGRAGARRRTGRNSNAQKEPINVPWAPNGGKCHTNVEENATGAIISHEFLLELAALDGQQIEPTFARVQRGVAHARPIGRAKARCVRMRSDGACISGGGGGWGGLASGWTGSLTTSAKTTPDKWQRDEDGTGLFGHFASYFAQQGHLALESPISAGGIAAQVSVDPGAQEGPYAVI